MESFIQNLDVYILYATSFIGFCTAAARGLEQLVKLTPTTKDDTALAKVQSALQSVSSILDKIGSLRTKPKA